MKNSTFILIGLLTGFINPFSLPLALATPPVLTLVYSGNLDGELEPCGCSDAGNFGGIKRRATLLQMLRKATPDLVAISAGGLLSSEGPTDGIKAEYILQGFATFQYDAIGLQWRDLSYGVDFIKQRSLPWVASNWVDKTQQALAPEKIISRKIQNHRYELQVFTWLDPDSSPANEMKGEHDLVSKDHKLLLAQIHQARQHGAITVLTSTLPLQVMQELIPLDDIDILFVRANYEEFGEPKQTGRTLVLQPGSRGMRIARLDLQFDKDNKITKWQHEVIPMPESMPDAPQLASWYDAYNATLKQDFERRAALRKKMQAGESAYIGAASCEACHAPQHKIWQESKHASAFEALENVNKSFDPFCVACHVVGYEKDGGFIDIAMSDNLIGVQCENCHGPGRQHVNSQGKQKTPNHDWPKPKICQQCHIHKHSPEFNLDQYWPKIAH